MHFLNTIELDDHLEATIDNILNNHVLYDRDELVLRELHRMRGSIMFIPSETNMVKLFNLLNLLKRRNPFFPNDLVTVITNYAACAQPLNRLDPKFSRKFPLFVSCKIIAVNGFFDTPPNNVPWDFDFKEPRKFIQGSPYTLLQIIEGRMFSSNFMIGLFNHLKSFGVIRMDYIFLIYFLRNYGLNPILLKLIYRNCIFEKQIDNLVRARLPIFLKLRHFFKASPCECKYFKALVAKIEIFLSDTQRFVQGQQTIQVPVELEQLPDTDDESDGETDKSEASPSNDESSHESSSEEEEASPSKRRKIAAKKTFKSKEFITDSSSSSMSPASPDYTESD